MPPFSVRHTVLSLYDRERWYEDLRPSSGASDFNPLACSASFFSFVGQHGNDVVVLPFGSVGKKRTHPMPAVRVGSEVRSFEWDPFCANNLATAGADGSVKVWSIPSSGLESELATPLVECKTVENRFSVSSSQAVPKGLNFHPCAPGLVATRGLRLLSLFDLTRPEVPCLSQGGEECLEGDILSMCWSYAGDVLLTTDKAKHLQLMDIRAGMVVAKTENCHGPGTSRVTWCGNSVYIATTGISSMSRERELAVWDARSVGVPVSRIRVGGSSSGFLVPHLDPGSGLLFLCGRGDSTVRLYSFDMAAGKASPVSTTTVGGISRGYAFVPRSSCDVMACEVTKVLKLCDGLVQPVSVKIPRKDMRRFHEDLFPPAPCGVPSVSAVDWLSGITIPPYIQPLLPPAPPVQGNNQDSITGVHRHRTEPVHPQQSKGEPVLSHVEGSDRKQPLGPAQETSLSTSKGVVEGVPVQSEPPVLVEGNEKRKEKRNEKRNEGLTREMQAKQWLANSSKLKFRHVFGKETRGMKASFNLTPLLTSMDTPIISCSTDFWAVPWLGGGGPVFVSPMSASGKVEPGCHLLNGHRAPVQSIAFSPFQPSLMASGSDDTTVKLWDLPDLDTPGGISSLESDGFMSSLTFNRTAVRLVEFHPAADNLLMTTNADHSLQICDIAAAGGEDRAVIVIDVHKNAIHSASFSGDGSLVATTSRDGILRIIDPRHGTVVQECAGHSGRKAQMSTWCHGAGIREVLATTGCAAAGHRQLCLWDPRNMGTPYVSKTVDSSNGTLFPIFNEATGMLFLASRGGSGIKYFEFGYGDAGAQSVEELCEALPSVHFCHEFKAAGEPLCGAAMLSPSVGALDIPAVEVARFLRLTCTTVEPVSFFLPRSNELKGFYQDDVYRPVRTSVPCMTSTEWLEGANSGDVEGRQYTSLCPEGMVPLSERPQPTNVPVSKAKIFREEMERHQQEEEHAVKTIQHLTALANQNAAYNPNRSMGVAMGVDEAINDDGASDGEWSD